MTRVERIFSVVLALAVTFAMLWPILGKRSRDAFPLSTYPMFTAKRQTAKIYSLALFESGVELKDAIPVPPMLISGDEVLLASQTIRRAVRRGRAAQMRLCREVAANVAKAEEHASAERVILLEDKHNSIDYFRIGPQAGTRRKIAGCRIPRDPQGKGK